MLAEALATVRHALAGVDEPHQVIVVANGTPAGAYDDLKAQFPEVEFVHADLPLGFVDAIERGVARARYDWTYLMNNDMTLDADTLSALLPSRSDDVFAVASQIYQQSADGRREETGFTDWYIDHSGLQLYHAPVRDDAVAPHLCASGGAALFRTADAAPLSAREPLLPPVLLGRRRMGRACMARRVARAVCAALPRVAPAPGVHRPILFRDGARPHRPAQPVAVRCAPRGDPQWPRLADGPDLRSSLRDPARVRPPAGVRRGIPRAAVRAAESAAAAPAGTALRARRARRAAATFVRLSPGCRDRGAADAPAHAADHAVRGLSAAARRCAARGRNRARPRQRVRRRADHRRGAAVRRAQPRPFRRPPCRPSGAARQGCSRARWRTAGRAGYGRIAIARSCPPSTAPSRSTSPSWSRSSTPSSRA